MWISKVRCAELSGAKCIGVEIDSERAQEAIKNCDSSCCSSLCKIICCNALDHDYADGTAFFLYLVPRGLRLILPLILGRTESSSSETLIRIVTYMSPLPSEYVPKHESKISTSRHPEAAWPLYYYEFNRCIPR